jgi:hypothetical protein
MLLAAVSGITARVTVAVDAVGEGGVAATGWGRDAGRDVVWWYLLKCYLDAFSYHSLCGRDVGRRAMQEDEALRVP